MSLERDVHRIISSAKVSTKRDKKTNTTIICDSSSFRALPLSAQDDINAMTEAYIKNDIEVRSGRKHKTLLEVEKESKEKVKKSIVPLFQGKNAKKVYDSFFNEMTNVNTDLDFSSFANALPNVWISPYEANTLYSQKGIFEMIINKKAKSILLNGVKIKNRFLTAKEIDKISENMLRLNFPKILSDGDRDSLVYGGSLVFPMYENDNPVTMGLSTVALIKAGVIGKGKLKRFVELDRWNTVHIPATNPTASDWLMPERFFIPFLGSDVHSSRCARVVTGEQAGYFGRILTMGWGLPDAVGYASSVMNYKNALNTVPLMIQQMSILARSINVDGILATEGPNIMDALQEENTIRTSKWSPNNPITLDVLGNIQVINRQFQHVPELIRLLRQDAASDAGIPEPMLWSSEKGNFSSGDDTQGNLAKQYESVKFIHKDVESCFKNLAKLIVIDTLGVSQRVLEALPYTEIHFDMPMIANSTERAEIGKNVADTFFQFVSGQMPVDKAASIASTYAGDELSISSDLLDELRARQEESDNRQKEKFDKEMELLEVQIENAKNGQGEGNTPSSPKGKGGYSKLEQNQHEKTKMPGEKKPEMLAKAQGKQQGQ